MVTIWNKDSTFYFLFNFIIQKVKIEFVIQLTLKLTFVEFRVVSESLRCYIKRYEKDHFFVLFILLEERGSSLDSKRQYAEWRHRNVCHKLTQCPFSGSLNGRSPRRGRRIDGSEFLRPSVELTRFWT